MSYQVEKSEPVNVSDSSRADARLEKGRVPKVPGKVGGHRCPHQRCASLVSSFSHRLHAVLVGLYEEPERPNDAVDYIKRYMGAPTGIDVREKKILFDRDL